MNWKEQLKNKWFVNDEQGGWTVAQGEVEDFIKSLLEQVIEDMPDEVKTIVYPVDLDKGSIPQDVITNLTRLKQQLKAKWLK